MDTITRMRAFVAVVDSGGFSAAARQTGRSKALMSKYVAELEEELGARLLNRTTRQLSLTEAGEAAYAEGQEILKRVDHLREILEASSHVPQGRLRISAPRAIGESDLSRAMMEFLGRHPDIRLELHLEDRFVDVVEEGYDCAIRITALTDSSLIARKLADFRVAVYAAPEVLASHGRPHHPSELAGMPCIIDTNVRSRANWQFREGDSRFSVTVAGRVEVNSPVAAAAAALAGFGFARGPWLLVRDHVRDGRLVTVLDEYELDGLGVFAIYPHRERMPVKVRAFIDHLVAWYQAERKAGRSP
ncbi:LysR family transcriptional regulator [Propylenella binzhouense]|uniref:LysR family transcriptional regulator n=1 Tax=Propylenella binzhouense TaxID=2555902 RepID=A0A964T4C8_9HYPH|nr:LysR family transcriptional regulator [Propylenella binzhouense]MYZ48248.1 LysR family transcriptional regulator [Propylenella binzhouense]